MAKTKRYNLVLPADLFTEIQRIAERDNTTVVEVFRKFIKLGLLADQIGNDPDSSLLIREGDQETKLIFI